MLLRVAEVHRVHHHADVGAVLPAHLAAGDVDHLDAVRVELTHRAPVLSPVAVGALEHDAPLLEEALEHQIDAELSVLHLARAEREVFVVDEYGDQRFGRHGGSMELGVPAHGVLDKLPKSRSPVDIDFRTAISGSEDMAAPWGWAFLPVVSWTGRRRIVRLSVSVPPVRACRVRPGRASGCARSTRRRRRAGARCARGGW